MTQKQERIVAKAVHPPPSHLQVSVPWNLVRLLMQELAEAYDQKSGPSLQLARLLDQIEEAVDTEAGVERVGARAS